MISKEEIKKIKKLHLKTGLMVDTIISGQYRSVFKGVGMEFEEVREYKPGDDVRAIDWKVSARIGKPFIKRYREEREISIMLMVDMSSSGLFGSNGTTKIEKTAELAGVAAYIAVKNNDRVGLILFTDEVKLYLPPRKGVAHVWRIIREIYTFGQRKNEKTDIGSALDFFGRVSKEKSICFLISDFISPDFSSCIKRLRRRHEIIGVRVFDKKENILPKGGVSFFMDPETGIKEVIDSGSKKLREKWNKMVLKKEKEFLLNLSSLGIDVLDLATDESSADVLINYFKSRHLMGSRGRV